MAFRIWGSYNGGLLEEAQGPGGKTEKFDSIEARCSNCRVYGGKFRPCLPKGVRDDIRARHGRPCPRILLDPDNLEALELANWDMHEGGLTSLGPFIFAAIRRESHLSKDHARRILSRAVSATGSRQVREAMDAAAKAEAKRKEAASK